MQRPLGWYRELPDLRDRLAVSRPETSLLLRQDAPFKLFNSLIDAFTGADYIDLAPFCSPIEDQGNIGSCTAQAGVGLIEYMEKRGRGIHVDASRLFLYKVTRNLLGWEGDTGAYCRTTLQAMAKFGLCPESAWPYRAKDYDKEPSAFCYAYAQSAKSLGYYRIDQSGQDGETLLAHVQALLRIGIPSMFGFTVYDWGNSRGEFEVPDEKSRVYGGHAVVAVGYDDNRKVGHSTGALKIRNSWGTDWGEDGYGWLPYEYVLWGLTSDWWCLFSQDYLGD